MRVQVCWVYMAGFWQRGDYRAGFCEKLLEASPPSRMNQCQLAPRSNWTKSICSAGSASGIMCLTRAKSCFSAAARGERRECMRATSLHTLRSLGPGGLHLVEETHSGAVHVLQPMGRTHVGEVCGELAP